MTRKRPVAVHQRAPSIVFMYLIVLTLHSLFRWVVLIGILAGMFRAYRGWLGRRAFTPLDNTLRHTSATLAHVQLILGYTLYVVSPLLASFHLRDAEHGPGTLFFGVQHVALMTVAILVLTIGSALAKRQPTDQQKFRTMAVWFTVALLLILVAIPWPFSPLAQRPLIRL
jgi:hypothetical protein